MMRPRTVAVEYNEAEAFVELMKRVRGMRGLGKDWDGEGSVAPIGPTIRSVERLAKDRQTMATRMAVAVQRDGTIAIAVSPGNPALGQGTALIVVDRAGKPILRAGDKPEQEYPSVSDKKFRKALDDAVSPRGTRYGRIEKPVVDGIKFDSPAEAKRYLELRQMERFGEVSDIRLQVAYPFIENGKVCFNYYADFVYVLTATGEEVVEDVKGMMTDIYRLKKKLIDARYGIRIQEWPVTKAELARREADARKAKAALEKEERRLQREARAAERQAEAEARAARRAAKAGGIDGRSAGTRAGENRKGELAS